MSFFEIFDLGLSFSFMTLNVNNSKKKSFQPATVPMPPLLHPMHNCMDYDP